MIRARTPVEPNTSSSPPTHSTSLPPVHSSRRLDSLLFSTGQLIGRPIEIPVESPSFKGSELSGVERFVSGFLQPGRSQTHYTMLQSLGLIALLVPSLHLPAAL